MNRRQLLLRLQLALLGVLVTIWWFTRPSSETQTEQAFQAPSPRPDLEAIQTERPSVHWSSHMDTSNPECVKLVDEIRKLNMEDTRRRVFHIGECDKRRQYE
ncbi:MAG: hypothetical protein AAF098_14560 [Pseudomonadota bacterium]